jgi:hydrogenase maturation protease
MILVIGYGNELRGDDALGPRVAAAIAARQLPGVQVLAPRQLLPELAAELAEARRIIFVDATGNREQHSVDTRPVEPSPELSALGHTSRPAEMLALTLALYGRCPPAWLITVPAERFELGAPLSPRAELQLPVAVQAVCALCEAPSP